MRRPCSPQPIPTPWVGASEHVPQLLAADARVGSNPAYRGDDPDSTSVLPGLFIPHPQRAPGNQVEPGEEPLGDRFRRLSNQLARAWALSSGSSRLEELRPAAGVFE